MLEWEGNCLFISGRMICKYINSFLISLCVNAFAVMLQIQISIAMCNCKVSIFSNHGCLINDSLELLLNQVKYVIFYIVWMYLKASISIELANSCFRGRIQAALYVVALYMSTVLNEQLGNSLCQTINTVLKYCLTLTKKMWVIDLEW